MRVEGSTCAVGTYWNCFSFVEHAEQFSGGLVFKAHILMYHSTLGLRVMKKKNSRLERKKKTKKKVRPARSARTGTG